jgi:hypothetical protein
MDICTLVIKLVRGQQIYLDSHSVTLKTGEIKRHADFTNYILRVRAT